MQNLGQFPYGVPFDVGRAILRSSPPARLFNVEQTISLQKAVDQNLVNPSTMLQLTEFDGMVYTFLTQELLVFDVAQGRSQNFDWIVTFCPICNVGAVFSATVDGRVLNFSAGGIYNAMAILRDIETGSYWDHVHGGCLHGDLKGKQLTRLGVLRHVSVAQALLSHPQAQFASAELDEPLTAKSIADDQWRRSAQPEWSARLVNTLLTEDTRRPRLDMGLGVWTGQTARYYPVVTVNMADNVIFDTLDGRRLLVYVDPITSVPDAFYTTASNAQWRGQLLILNTGETLVDSVLRNKGGKQIYVERPFQLFQRWYGFSSMFPRCEVYAGKDY